MSIGRKHIIHQYTIIEVMMAMGIFLVMMTIMMQFFTSAQKIWNTSSKRNAIYADARVAMNLMTREVQCMLYKNSSTEDSSIYPFWYEWTDIDVDHDGGVDRPDELKDFFIDNKDLGEQQGGSNNGNPYLTALNFITATDLKAVDQGSDVCEVRYKFVPVYFTSNSPKSVNDVKGGLLQRSCVEQYYDNSGTITLTPSTNDTDAYNFAVLKYTGATTDANRVGKIWKDEAEFSFRTVIKGVYSLRFSCYVWNSGLAFLQPMDINQKDSDNNDTSTTYNFDLATGSPVPVAVRIDMKLMDPQDLKKLAINIYLSNHGSSAEKKEAAKQVQVLKRKIRTFSKVIYLGKLEN